MKDKKKLLLASILGLIGMIIPSNGYCSNQGFIPTTIEKTKNRSSENTTEEESFVSKNKQIKQSYINPLRYHLFISSSVDKNPRVSINGGVSKQLLDNPGYLINPIIALNSNISATVNTKKDVDQRINNTDFAVTATVSNKMFNVFKVGINTDLYTCNKNSGLNKINAFGSMNIVINDKLSIKPQYKIAYSKKTVNQKNDIKTYQGLEASTSPVSSKNKFSHILSVGATYIINDKLHFGAGISHDLTSKNTNSDISMEVNF